MPKQDYLYFVAIVPPQAVSDEITSIKKEFAEHYASSKALKVLPHITLKAPFSVAEEEETSVVEWFLKTDPGVASFEVQLDGFGAFEKKDNPVIFIAPGNSLALQHLQKTLLDDFRKHFPTQTIMHPEWHYKPHITIGYRDLTPENFSKAWAIYQPKSFKSSFTATAIHLLKHNRRQWNIVQSKSLANDG